MNRPITDHPPLPVEIPLENDLERPPTPSDPDENKEGGIGPGTITAGTVAAKKLRDASKGSAKSPAPITKQNPRYEPRNLEEQLVLKEAKGGAGKEIMKDNINDPRYPTEFWAKKQHVHTVGNQNTKREINVHYWEHRFNIEREGFKFKNP